MGVEIKGTVKSGFESVRDCYLKNFTRDDELKEIGSSLVVYLHGEKVVDLWGGYFDAERTREWTPDTLVNIWSATKGIAAIEVAMLVDQGKLDYDAPVARYWPEFAAQGKGEATVSQLMSHQVGLPGFEKPITLEQFYDWETVVTRLAEQAPMWPPGTKNSYHAMTYGFLAGELVRRASGKNVGRFLAEDLAGPLGADVFIGLPESEEHRVSALVPSPLQSDLQAVDPSEVPPEALIAVTNPDMNPNLPQQRAWRAAEIPAGNGHATARGIARIYGAVANGGTLDGVTIMSRETIDRLVALQSDRIDILNGRPVFWRNGFHGNIDGMYGPWDDTVGHSGWGGSCGCVNPDRGLAIGYTVKQMSAETIGDPRAAALCHEICSCL